MNDIASFNLMLHAKTDKKGNDNNNKSVHCLHSVSSFSLCNVQIYLQMYLYLSRFKCQNVCGFQATQSYN